MKLKANPKPLVSPQTHQKPPSLKHRAELGRRGEALAADYLLALGFDMCARNWRTRSGELDLIVRRGDVLVFVEVRSRSGGGIFRAEQSVGPQKQAQVCRVARIWLSEHPEEGKDVDIRFDVVGVSFPGGEITHYRGAFSWQDRF